MPKAGNINRKGWLPGLLALAMMAVALAAAGVPACAPASSVPAGGVGAGETAPPFAMQLADGSQVTLKSLVDDRQPAFLMYFATW